MSPRLHLVDGTYELFRAHFSPRPSPKGPDGRDVKATVGLTMALLRLLESGNEAVTHIAVAFDNPIRSFRNDLFAGYKTEEGVPPELLAQFDLAEEATAALGLTVWSMKEWEADDAMAAAAARWKGSFDQVRILSPDKDMAQCLDGAKVVQVNWRTSEETDENAFVAQRGFSPKSVPDFLALVGDAADGIPGLPGFGEKGTAALLGRYRKLEDIPPDASAWEIPVRGAPKMAAALKAGRAEAVLYRTLATLVEDVPLPQGIEDLRFAGVPKETFRAFCQKIGALDLAERPTRWR